jgi:hypothetical protein
MKKSLDPRFLQLVADTKWLGEYQYTGDDTEFVERFAKYAKLLEQVAADRSLSSDDREAAQAMLDMIRAQLRALVPEALRALARTARLDDAAPEIRERARRALEAATRRLPAISEELQ